MDTHQIRGLDELISSCGQSHTTSLEFIWHLGLPIGTPDQESSRRGRPRFDDDSGTVKDLYRLTTQVTASLAVNYEHSMEQLRNDMLPVSPEFLDEFTAGMLAKHGHTIWSASEPFLTRINSAYPRHLSFANPQDKRTIKELLYYWIVHRALRKLAGSGGPPITPSNARNTRTDGGSTSVKGRGIRADSSDPYSLSEESDVEQSSSVDQADSRQTRNRREIKLELSHRGGQTSSMATKTNENLAVPVAQMLPQHFSTMTAKTSYSKSTAMQPSTIHQPNMPGDLQAVRVNMSSSNHPFHSPGSDTIIVRRDSLNLNETSSHGTQSTKRQVQPSDEETSKKIRMTRNSGKEITSQQFSPQECAQNKVISFHPHVFSMLSNNELDTQSATTSTSEGTASFNNQQNVTVGGNSGIEESVQGCPATMASVTTASLPGKRSSLVVVLKLRNQEALGTTQETDTPPVPSNQPQNQESQLGSEQLTLDVLDLFDASESGHQDLRALRDTVLYLQHMVTDGASKLKQKFGDSFEKYKATLAQWLELANKFIEFRQLTEFNGDRNGWIEYFHSLGPERKRVARRAFFETRVSITKLREEFGHDLTETSKHVAEVLYHMASWEGMMDLTEMRTSCTRFNKSLLEWFRQPVSN